MSLLQQVVRSQHVLVYGDIGVVIQQLHERLKLAMSAGRMGFADFDVEEDTINIDQTVAGQFAVCGEERRT